MNSFVPGAERSAGFWHGLFWSGVGLFTLGALGTPLTGYLDVMAAERGADHGLLILVLGALITLAGIGLSILSLVKVRRFSSKAFAAYRAVLALLFLGALGLYVFLVIVAK